MEAMGQRRWTPAIPESEVIYAELGASIEHDPGDRLPWDRWPKEAPQEGDDDCPDDYKAPEGDRRRPAEEGQRSG